jgi:hypothetical protein
MKMKHHIDTKVMKIITAKEQTFENSTLRAFSQFERVQIKTMMSNKMNAETTLAVHRADSASDRRRDRERERSRERRRERERRERKQAVSK